MTVLELCKLLGLEDPATFRKKRNFDLNNQLIEEYFENLFSPTDVVITRTDRQIGKTTEALLQSIVAESKGLDVIYILSKAKVPAYGIYYQYLMRQWVDMREKAKTIYGSQWKKGTMKFLSLEEYQRERIIQTNNRIIIYDILYFKQPQ